MQAIDPSANLNLLGSLAIISSTYPKIYHVEDTIQLFLFAGIIHLKRPADPLVTLLEV